MNEFNYNPADGFKYINRISDKPKKEFYNKIIETREIIAEARKKEINFKEPFLWLNGDPVFFPNTINIIQGKAGMHKSRLAEIIAAAILKALNCKNELLGFVANEKYNYNVCYVDTERNIRDQLPFSMRRLMQQAGHDPAIELDNFEAISLLEFDREDRFTALEDYIREMKRFNSGHTVIILDVITDCLNNFNDAKDSLHLIDLMNRCINSQDVTFICLIHENPGIGSDKARGHLGTEILNKATTAIQVGFEKDKSGNLMDILKISFIKCRNSRKHQPTYAYYSDIEKGLMLADSKLVQESLDKKREKASLEEVKAQLKILLTGSMKKADLVAHLMRDLNASEKTIENRLTEIYKQTFELENMHHQLCRLNKTTKTKDGIEYYLEPIMPVL